MARLYFYTTSIDSTIADLRGYNERAEKKFSISVRYGGSPDAPQGLTVLADGCARMIIRQVPEDHVLCQRVFQKAVEVLRLDKSWQLVYRG